MTHRENDCKTDEAHAAQSIRDHNIGLNKTKPETWRIQWNGPCWGFDEDAPCIEWAEIGKPLSTQMSLYCYVFYNRAYELKFQYENAQIVQKMITLNRDKYR